MLGLGVGIGPYMPKGVGILQPSILFRDGEAGFVGLKYDPNSLLRRVNMLNYSSDFTNAVWPRSNILSITSKADGIGDLMVPSVANTQHSINQSGAPSPGVSNCTTVRAKPGGYDWLIIQIGASAAWFNVATGTVGSVSAGITASIVAASGAPGYYDCTISVTASSNNYLLFAAPSNSVSVFAGDGVSGVYLARAQLEWNTATPSAYQNVTDWNTEYVAAALEYIGLWQDAGGTIPVTAVEQPIGLWMDSKLGSFWEREGNYKASFTTQLLGAAPAATYSGVTGMGTCERVDAANQSYIRLSGFLNATVEITITNTGANQINVRSGAIGGPVYFSIAAGQTTRGIVPASSGQVSVASASGVASFTVVLVQIISVGHTNHAYQGNSSSRPILSARYNLLSKTEQFDDVAWTKSRSSVAATGYSSPNGSATARKIVEDTTAAATHRVYQGGTKPTAAAIPVVFTVSVKAGERLFAAIKLTDTTEADQAAVAIDLNTGQLGAPVGSFTNISASVVSQGDGWWRVTLSATTDADASVYGFVQLATSLSTSDAYSGDGVSGIYAWGADIRTAIDAAKAMPSYQRVNTATDYDTTNFIFKLNFDGTDDSLQIPNVEFAGWGSAMAIVGLTKLSDAAAAVLLELTANAGATVASWGVYAPASAAGNYGSRSAGGTIPATAAVTASSYNAPIANTVSFIGYTVIDFNELYVDGPVAASLTDDQGAGGYSNSALNIGRRNNTSLPFSGSVTSIIVRSAHTAANNNGYRAAMEVFTNIEAGT